MEALLRSWNLFHGNAVPPERRAFLRDMVRLATADGPHVLLLQEVPVWALPELASWSRMQACGETAQPPRIGPVPVTAAIGRRLTEIDNGRLRSAFSGQANAILVAPQLRVEGCDRIVLNSRRFRAAQARALGLGASARLAWGRERRVCQAVRLRREDGSTLVVANLHATSFAADPRLADAELIRAATFVEAVAEPREPFVLAGDFNARVASSRALPELEAWGLAGGGSGVDHVYARGLALGPIVRWDDERRRIGGRLLSDHAPLEVTIE